MKFKIIIFLVGCIYIQTIQAQFSKKTITKDDTLRGTLNEYRTWWDVTKYDITVTPNIDSQSITGKVLLSFISTISGDSTLQIDLQDNMVLDSVFYKEQPVIFKKMYKNIWHVLLTNVNRYAYEFKKYASTTTRPLDNQELTLYFHGKPRIAKMPPWDGGWIWKKDANNNPWISVACQGLGASCWYPCKDHQSDKPNNGATLHIIVPDSLVAVANGKLISSIQLPPSHYTTYIWQVINPINTYNIVPYIGKYENFTDTFMGKHGMLNLSYWVLNYNVSKAKTQFTQTKQMLRAFEYSP